MGDRVRKIAPWLVALLGLGALQLVAISAIESTSRPKEVDRWFPRTVGTTWLYSSRSSGQDSGMHVVQVVAQGATLDGAATVLESRWDNLLGGGPSRQFQYQGASDDRLVLHGQRFGGSYLPYEPPQPQWERSLTPGGSFEWTGTFGTEQQRVTVTFAGEETVPVVGVTQEGCRHYRQDIVVTQGSGEAERSYEAWLCPGIGAVRTAERAPDLGYVLEEELVGFRSPERRLGDVTDAPSAAVVDEAPGQVPGIDSARTGSVPNATVDFTRLAWSDGRKEEVKFPPVGRADLLVLAEQDGTVSAMRPATGEILWRVVLAGPVPVSPVVHGTLVLAAAADKTLSALDAGTGRPLWTVELPDVPAVAPLVARDAVIVAGQDRRVRALSLDDGRERWQAQTGDIPASPPALAGGVVVVADKAGGVAALRLSDGATQWSTALERRWVSGPAVAGDRVIVMDKAGIISAFDTASGSLEWSRYIELDVEVPLVVARDTVLLVPNGDRIRALDRRDGSDRWQARLDAETDSQPLVVGDSVIVATTEPQLQRRSLADGSLAESRPLTSPTPGSAVRANLPPVWVDTRVIVVLDLDLPWPRTNVLAFGPGPGETGVRLTGLLRSTPGLVAGLARVVGTDLVVPSGDQSVKVVPPSGPARTLLQSDAEVPYAVPAGDVVIAHRGTEVVAVPLAGGDPRWALPAGAPVRGTEPVVAGDAVVVPINGGGVVSVDLATGRPRWIHPVPSSEGTSSPVVLPGGDVVYAVGGLARLDGRTGQPRWSVPGVTVYGPVAVTDREVVAAAVTATGSSLLAVDLATGVERWRQPFNPSLLVGPAAGAGVVVAVDAAGNVVALDAATGRPVWSQAMRTTPSATPVVVGDKVVLAELGRDEDSRSRDTRLSVHDLRTGRYLGSLEPRGFSFLRGTIGATQNGIAVSMGSGVLLLELA
jgi:outer membrane protein assembly factor BamB